MPQRTTLDAMIPRADFAEESEEFLLDLFRGFPIAYLTPDATVLKLLRKPDFQRETNHWSPEQLSTFIASFLDGELIPSLILWKSKNYVFVIDGGHRLSALRAWMEDDYGDRAVSLAFYGGEIPDEQKRIAKRTRDLVEKTVGRFSTLKAMVGSPSASASDKRRAGILTTRELPVQWIQGNSDVAETSFFKINTQGTALDETEEMLIKNRKKSIAIGARAILRAGAGHRYWSKFPAENQRVVEDLAAQFYRLVFEPDLKQPVRTLDLPLGGSVSPVDALGLLLDFLTITGKPPTPPTPPAVAGKPKKKPTALANFKEDTTGEETIEILKRSLEVVHHITGNSPKSHGLHPAVYFYNDRGKYSRFMFLGISLMFTEKIRNNDRGFFKKFKANRAKLEDFLIHNRSMIGILLQNMAKSQRVGKMRDLFATLINDFEGGKDVTTEEVIKNLGLKGRVIDVVASKGPVDFTDEAKSTIYIRSTIKNATSCPLCGGKLDPSKSVSYDHKQRVKDGGTGEPENGDLVHPYCNSVKN